MAWEEEEDDDGRDGDDFFRLRGSVLLMFPVTRDLGPAESGRIRRPLERRGRPQA